MKKLIYSTIIFSFAFLSAQKKSSNSFSIEYEFVTTLGKTFKNNAILKCNAKQSIYQLIKSQEKDQDIVDDNDDISDYYGEMSDNVSDDENSDYFNAEE